MENVKNKEWQVRLREKSAYVIFIVFFYLFMVKEWWEYDFLPFMGYVDEIIALLAIPLWFISLFDEDKRMKLKEIGYGTPIAVFVLFGLAGSLYYNYQPFFQIAMPQLLLWVKFWLAVTTGKFLFKNLNLERYAKRIFLNVKLMTWLFTVLIIVDNVIGVFEPVSVRYGLRSTHLFYNQVTVFVSICVFLIAILVSIKDYVKGDSLYFVWLCLLMCTTLRSKAFGAAIAFIVIYRIVTSKAGKVNIVHIMFIAPILIIVAWGQISFYFFDSRLDDAARYQLYTQSVNIAKDHFPFGSGFGTIATHFSSVIYSPLYHMYGMDKVWGLTEKSAKFSNDTFWPAVLGESGWVGFVFYILAVVILIWQIQRLRRTNNGWYMAGLFIIMYELIASMAEAAFLSSLAVPLAVWLGFILSKGEESMAMKKSKSLDLSNEPPEASEL